MFSPYQICIPTHMCISIRYKETPSLDYILTSKFTSVSWRKKKWDKNAFRDKMNIVPTKCNETYIRNSRPTLNFFFLLQHFFKPLRSLRKPELEIRTSPNFWCACINLCMYYIFSAHNLIKFYIYIIVIVC